MSFFILTIIQVRTKLIVRYRTKKEIFMSKKQTFDLFRNAWTDINVTYEQYAKSLGISYSTLSVLCEIYNSDTLLTQKIICDITQLPKTTVNAIIRDFTKKELVELKPMKDDKRQKGVCLTDKGAQYAEPIVERMNKSELNAFESLDEQTQKVMLAGLATYQRSLNNELNEEKK